jgi:hypothetical protein
MEEFWNCRVFKAWGILKEPWIVDIALLGELCVADFGRNSSMSQSSRLIT